MSWPALGIWTPRLPDSEVLLLAEMITISLLQQDQLPQQLYQVPVSVSLFASQEDKVVPKLSCSLVGDLQAVNATSEGYLV